MFVVSPTRACYTADTVMIARYQSKGFSWVDLEAPTSQEVSHIAEEFQIPGFIAEELSTNTLRSKVDIEPLFIYSILHFPRPSAAGLKVNEQEIDFVIGKNFLITVHYEVNDCIRAFSKKFEIEAGRDRGEAFQHGGLVFAKLARELYRQSLHDLDGLAATLREVENEIFRGQEARMVEHLSVIGKKLLDFKQAVRFHADLLRSYESASRQFFGDSYGYHASLVTAEHNKVASTLENLRDILFELQRTNDSLLSAKSNEIMKTFTVLSFVILPLTLITGVFGMSGNFNLIHDIRDFYLVIVAMGVTSLIMFLFFKMKRWL